MSTRSRGIDESTGAAVAKAIGFVVTFAILGGLAIWGVSELVYVFLAVGR